MRFSLRDYQKKAIHAVLQQRREGYRRLLVCLPTGAGKTVIFSELCRLAKRDVLVLAHREELLTQAKNKIEGMTEGAARVDIEQGENTASEHCNVVVASIRSLRTERLERLKKSKDFGLIIYDECHHAAAEDNMRVLRELGCFDADWDGTLLGFTATTTRGDGIGLGEVFELIAYERSVVEMIKEQFLVPLKGYRINTAVDLYNIMGDSDADLEEHLDIESRNALVARSIQELARDRRTIVFCVSVHHAINLGKSLNALGIPTGVIYGAMPKDKRVETLRLFREEKLLALTNVGVLTEGFDDPGVSCIAMARPTKSESLYAQCIGRGARLAPGKTDCIVLDFVDLSDLSLVNLPSLLGLPKELNLQGAEVTEALSGEAAPAGYPQQYHTPQHLQPYVHVVGQLFGSLHLPELSDLGPLLSRDPRGEVVARKARPRVFAHLRVGLRQAGTPRRRRLPGLLHVELTDALPQQKLLSERDCLVRVGGVFGGVVGV